MGKCGKFVGIVLAAVFVMGGAAAQATCRADQVHLRGDWGQARFVVEVADDRAERNRGLMFRESLPQSAGMLFVYDRPGRISFWMKNTLIPLDIIFLDRTGTVVNIHANAEPLSTAQIFGGMRIQYVLEINGGLASRLGVTEGSVLRHPALDQSRAAWTC